MYVNDVILDNIEAVSYTHLDVYKRQLQTGCTSSMKLYQNLVENMVLTPSLDAIYEKYITELGNHVKHVPDIVMPGSSDVGNISQVVPTIQPHISITDHAITCLLYTSLK